MGSELSLLGALTLGLFGGLHCLGMCGGISAALGSAMPPQHARVGHLAYNFGRMSSYALAGAVAGGAGFRLLETMGPSGVLVLRALAGAFLVAVGLYLSGWWMGLGVLEQGGATLWRHIAPLAQRIGPPDTPWKMFAVGAVWGWLPCGLVYAALAGALAAGGAAQGALFMASFGLGTLPAMLATGASAGLYARLRGDALTRTAASVLMIGFGLWTIGAAAWMTRGASDGAPACHGDHQAHVETVANGPIRLAWAAGADETIALRR